MRVLRNLNPKKELHGRTGITPVVSSVGLDFNAEVPEITDYKLEGLSILNANEVAISNDNDFGVTMDPEAKSKMWIIRLKDQLPLCRSSARNKASQTAQPPRRIKARRTIQVPVGVVIFDG